MAENLEFLRLRCIFSIVAFLIRISLGHEHAGHRKANEQRDVTLLCHWPVLAAAAAPVVTTRSWAREK